MKKNIERSKICIYATTLLLSVFCLAGCGSDEKLGLNSDDKVPPGIPAVVGMRSTAGGAIITFKAPKDDDLLCVTASYMVNGIKHITKASPYVDTLQVEGFGEAGTYPVVLKSVDKSNNESDPVEITIDADTPPVTTIFESMRVLDSFGGVKIFWENKSQVNIIIEVTKKDGDDWVSLENFYSSAKDAIGTVRGQAPEPITLRFRVRDRWDNYSPYKELECLPLEEVQLNKGLFKAVDPLPGDAPPMSDLYLIPRIWDGITNANECFHGTDDPQTYSIGRTITFDMGQEAQLSRFKMWQRTNSSTFIYSHNNLKRYKIYGCKELTTEMYNGGRVDEAGRKWPTFEGWTYLVDVECYKPSGDSGIVTNEDKEYIMNGDEHEFPIEIPRVRYIRIYMLESWSRGIVAQIAEMTFWGQPTTN